MTPEQIRKRIRGLSTYELTNWLDMALAGAQHHLDDYRRTKDEAEVGEINIGLIAINAVVDELLLRSKAEAEDDAK
jgi:hypothetical protein